MGFLNAHCDIATLFIFKCLYTDVSCVKMNDFF